MVFSLENVYFQHSDHRNIDLSLVLCVFRGFRQAVWCVFRGCRQDVWGSWLAELARRVGSRWMPKIAIFLGKKSKPLTGTTCFPILFGPPERQIHIFGRQTPPGLSAHAPEQPLILSKKEFNQCFL